MIDLKNKRLWSIVLAISVVAAISANYWLKQQTIKVNVTVQEQQDQVKRGDIVVGFDSDGNVDFSTVNLRFDVRGAIAEILVKEGDQVNKGDIIARLDSEDYQEQYQLVVAKLRDAERQQSLNQLKLERELTELRDVYQEMEAIPNAYTAKEIKLKEKELAAKELEYQQSLDNQLEQQELEVEMAQKNLNDIVLYAPISGVVMDLANKVGESVTDEQDFATIHAGNEIKATTNVIEYDVNQIKPGQKAYVTVEALPDHKFEAVVSKVDSMPSQDSSGLVNYAVEVVLKEPTAELKDGMTCTISFVRKEVKDCLIVPYKAVKIVDGKQMVTIINEKGEQVDKQIKTGFTDGTSVEVVDGLKGNETVVYKSR